MTISSQRRPAEIIGDVINYMDSNDEGHDDPFFESAAKALTNYPQFTKYKLSSQDVKIISVFWDNYVNYRTRMLSIAEVCGKIGIDPNDVNKCMECVEDLIERKIIQLEVKLRKDSFNNPLMLLVNDYSLCQEIKLKILDYDFTKAIESRMSSVWLNDDDFFDDLRMILDYVYEVFDNFKDASQVALEDVNSDSYYDVIQPMIERIQSCDQDLFVTKLFRDNSLDTTEMHIILLAMYSSKFQHDSIFEKAVLNIISRTKEEYMQNRQYFAADSKLVRNSLLESEKNLFSEGLAQVNLNSSIFDNILHPESLALTETTGLSSYMGKVSAFQKVKTSQTLKSLILQEDKKKLLKTFVSKYQDPQRFDLSGWGLAFSGAQDFERHKGFVSLFYGYPGTGKTFAAGAIANELGKELISIDCTKFRDCYYGKTEKHVSKAFKLMKEMSQDLEDPPVFLLNEADQLFANRVFPHSTASKVENMIQSVILEELESFTGILILTTNMEHIIDEAYFRRINLKICFDKPDFECRKKLWYLHLSQKIPGYETIDVEYLAKHYEFTGGQISLVLQNACSEAVIREVDKRQLTMNDLIEYSDLENGWQRNREIEKIKIGFKRN
jgi:AAA+ superfamily predicted ATPase